MPRLQFIEVATPNLEALTATRGPAGPAVVAPQLLLAPQDPPLAPREETIFLLQTAAEIEHSLLTQYLFLAYSLPPSRGLWRNTLLQIAKEEMGHLMSMQNALLALGGPLHFDREGAVFNIFYPFAYTLAPLSLQAVARFVLAEAPLATAVPPALGYDETQVRVDANLGGAIVDVRRIGALFDRLITVAAGLDDAGDFAPQSANWQADPATWQAGFFNLRLSKVSNKADLIALMQAISAQGEGAQATGLGDRSHFERFLDLYKQVKAQADAPGAGPLALPIVSGPTLEDDKSSGYIQHPTTRLWAALFDHRYRWLLMILQHSLRLEPGQLRGDLEGWALADMHSAITPIASLLVGSPLRADIANCPNAAPPFELPYTLDLPDRPIDLWRQHEFMAQASIAQLANFPGNAVANTLGNLDQSRLNQIKQIVASL